MQCCLSLVSGFLLLKVVCNSFHIFLGACNMLAFILVMVFKTASCCAGDLLMLLNVSSDDKILPTTYGELRPPLGKHRLKVHFILSS